MSICYSEGCAALCDPTAWKGVSAACQCQPWPPCNSRSLCFLQDAEFFVPVCRWRSRLGLHGTDMPFPSKKLNGLC